MKNHNNWKKINTERPGTIVRKERIGRNDKCFCGSDKKYKRCCLFSANIPSTPAEIESLKEHIREREKLS